MASISCNGTRSAIVRGRTVFDYADSLAVRVASSCGRSGICHECIVEVARGGGALGPPTDAEDFLTNGYRLACQAVIEREDVDVEFLLPRRRIQILTRTIRSGLTLDPMVVRRGNEVFYGNEPVDRYRGHIYGIALDIGTTTIVAELIDLETGDTAGVLAFENPQRFGGSDVMHRISYDSGPHCGELHKSVIRALNHELSELYASIGVQRRTVYEIVAVGNSTMRDLFFNLDVQSIGQRPYRSAVEHDWRNGSRSSTSLVEFAHRLGLATHPKARVIGGPLISGHVGADAAADLLAVEEELPGATSMIVDIGTNTEVIVCREGRIVAASCPAGPAFEGGLIKYGMTAAAGAIEALRLVDGRWDYRVIGDVAPKGICGSALIDLLAEMRRHGMMSAKGVFPNRAREITVVPDCGITFSRDDMSHLAQAKAANYCGQLIAMRTLGVRPSEIDRLYLAGGFANYIDVRNAIEIGFLPPVPEQRIVKVGNASLAGAREMLLARGKREAVERLVRRVEHVELEVTADFFEMFVDGCQFNPMSMN
jgi:uncharacterized 2Fe-2S/4Fe-4S cluster protein (DUF4445 family)